jgi:hypothetical protein
MIGSIVRVVVWLTVALCGFTIVAYVKTQKAQRSKAEKAEQEEKNVKKEEKVDDKKADLEVSDDNPFSALAKSLKQEVDKTLAARETTETIEAIEGERKDVKPENIITFVFLGMGAIFAAVSWIVDQECHTSYVGLPLFMSILLVCFGLGGVAAMVILACLSTEDGEKVTTLASVLTGVVFLSGLTLFQKCM